MPCMKTKKEAATLTQNLGLRTQDESCYDIDFVITWVDGSDPEWQKQKNLYLHGQPKSDETDSSEARYRDYGILQYWFRAAEKYAPWVRKVHFVTCGQVPEWLNLNHQKLHFVKHEDYIPREWLPTFSSFPIELNMHRIDGLSEKFVYFNDDMFLNAPVKPEDFFVNGQPCDCAVLTPIPSIFEFMGDTIINSFRILYKYFDFRKQFKANAWKWLHPKYGKFLLRTLYFLPCYWQINKCIGLYEPHTAVSFLKSTFTEVWDKEREYLSEVSGHRFRNKSDVHQWLMEWWQVMAGNFHPRSPKFSGFYGKPDPRRLIHDIKRKTHKLICINDISPDALELVRQAYEEVFPDKSAFEV